MADPCGECDSCRDLARGGSGSIDVIEIDAASHGGVDDARDLREKAFFAPVKSKYKVYIIDEAHMVTTQGFNALLKLVEEPPPHLRFIFATTEPDKVLSTIRSRTHHYPFRLIPPRLLSSYLSELCELEGVAIEPAALPLIVRAGAGSARDSLSILDQLLGGAGPEGITHTLATGLLGYTPDSLLDAVVDAFAAGDGAAAFGVVDRVIETGQDPRRFAEDLLRRLRDLVIVAAVPDAPATGLIDVSQDQGERLVAQAARFGKPELSRAADIVATGLTEMRGATAPRLLLELVCARVLLPGADHATEGVMARLDRLEKRASISGGTPSGGPVAPTPPPRSGRAPRRAGGRGQRPGRPCPGAGAPGRGAGRRRPADTRRRPRGAGRAEPAAAERPPAAQPTGGLTLVDVRNLWPDIVEATKMRRRVAWMHLTQNSQVIGIEGNTLTLGFMNVGARDSFINGGCDEILRQAAIDVVGADWRIDAIVDPGAKADPAPSASRQAPPAASPAEPVEAAAAPTEPPAWAADDDTSGQADQPDAEAAQAPEAPARPSRAADPESIAAARGAIAQTRTAGAAPTGDSRAEADADAHPDDPDADNSSLGSAELLERELGAQMIEEIRHQ